MNTVFVRGLSERELAELDALADRARLTRAQAAARVLRRALVFARELGAVRNAEWPPPAGELRSSQPRPSAILPPATGAVTESPDDLWSCPGCGEYRMACEGVCRCGVRRADVVDD